MRVVVVGPAYPYRGGIAHYTSGLVQNLIAREHDTTLVSFRRQYPLWLYPGHSDVDPSHCYQPVQAQFMLDPMNPLSWLRTANYIASLKPDLVSIQWWTTFWSPAYIILTRLLKQRGVRVSYLAHNVQPHESHFGDRALTRLTLRQGAGCLVWTQSDRETLKKFAPNLQIQVCSMPVCPLPTTPLIAQSKAREILGTPSDIPVVLFFGLVRHYKGLRYLIDAAAHLRDVGKPVYVIVAGECWERRSEYDRVIAKLGLGDLVRFEARYIPNEEVSTYFSAADVLVAPYIEHTQSAVSTMAIRFNLPLVMTRPLANGLSRYIDNPLVKVVEEADAQALAMAISTFCEDTGSRQQTIFQQDDGWGELVNALEKMVSCDSLNHL